MDKPFGETTSDPSPLQQAWGIATAPLHDIAEPAREREARFTAAVATVTLALGVIATVSTLLPGQGNWTTGGQAMALSLMGGATLAILAAYILSRTAHYTWGAFLLVSITWLATILTNLAGTESSTAIGLVYLALPILLSSLLLPTMVTLTVAASLMVQTFILPSATSAPGARQELLTFLFVFTLLAVAVHRLRERDLQQLDEQARNLRESRERVRQLFSASFEAIIVHEGTEIIDANPMVSQLFGIRSEEAVGVDLGTVIQMPADDERWARITAESAGAFELTGRRSDGTTFPMEARSRDIEYRGQDLRVTVLRDITQRKDSEHHQARRAEAEARRAELEQLVWLTSHALRSPVRTVRSFTQLLTRHLGEDLDAQTQEYVDFLAAGTHQLDNLLNDLRTFAEVITREAVHRATPLTAVAEGALEDVLQRDDGRDVEVQIDPLPTVVGDSVQLHHLFTHLFENAVFAQEDEEWPRIRVRSQPMGRGWRIEVMDAGPGIEREHRQRVFEIFQRLDHGQDPDRTGIGLALCNRVVEQHGGDIWIEDGLDGADGKGASVVFTLPGEQVAGQSASGAADPAQT